MESKKVLRAINKFSGINIKDNKSRKRPVVEAKQLYSKLMRDSGHTYESIGDTIGLGHATILHHYNNYNIVKMCSKDLQDLEFNVLTYIYKDDREIVLDMIDNLKKEIKKLEGYLSHSTNENLDVNNCLLEK